MCWDYSTDAKDIRKIIFHSLKEIARYLFYSGLFLFWSQKGKWIKVYIPKNSEQGNYYK